MSDNGLNGAAKGELTEGRPAIFIYEALSGVIFHITPINLPTFRAIQLKAQDLFPYPEKQPYEIAVPNNVSFEPNQVEPAESNPAYIAACQAVEKERKYWVDRAVFNYAVKCPKYPTPQALVEGFKSQLEALRAISKIDKDDYETVLFHIVLSWNQPAKNKDTGAITVTSNEYGRIIEMAVQTVALSAPEVSAGIRFFRPYLSERRT